MALIKKVRAYWQDVLFWAEEHPWAMVSFGLGTMSGLAIRLPFFDYELSATNSAVVTALIGGSIGIGGALWLQWSARLRSLREQREVVAREIRSALEDVEGAASQSPQTIDQLTFDAFLWMKHVYAAVAGADAGAQRLKHMIDCGALSELRCLVAAQRFLALMAPASNDVASIRNRYGGDTTKHGFYEDTKARLDDLTGSLHDIYVGLF